MNFYAILLYCLISLCHVVCMYLDSPGCIVFDLKENKNSNGTNPFTEWLHFCLGRPVDSFSLFNRETFRGLQFVSKVLNL